MSSNDQLPTAPPAIYQYGDMPDEEIKDQWTPEEIRASISVRRVMSEIQECRDILAGKKPVPRCNTGAGLKMPDVIALKARLDTAMKLLDKLLPNLKPVEAVPPKVAGLLVRRLDGSTPEPGDADYKDPDEEEQEL